MITIDGARGEGGGQIVRTSLALSLATGQPVTIENLRAGRARPGLQRQHLTAVLAAREVGGAEVVGAELNSTRLEFRPGAIRAGDYRFDTGGAGSTTLVLQTVLPALALADAPSHVTLRGGTHNPMAPPFDFLALAYLPLWSRLGPRVEARLLQPGFYPAGGGKMTVTVAPSADWKPFDLLERGQLLRRCARALVSNLPEHIGQRECRTACESLGWGPDECRVDNCFGGRGPGNAVVIEIVSEHVAEVCTAFGERGVRAETVAQRAANQAERYLAASAPAGEHLADQWMLPLALAAHRHGCRSKYRAIGITQHALTHAETIAAFLNARVQTRELGDDDWEVSVGPA